MRTLVYCVTALLLTTNVALSQKLFVGPTLMFKGGLNAGNIPDGQKTAFNIHTMPDITANILWLFNKGANLGLMGDVGLATYSYRMRPESESIANDENTLVTETQYFIVAPSFFFSGFTIGAAFGFPTSIDISNVSGSMIVTSTSTDNLTSPLIELRAGGMIPVWETPTGRLSAIVQFGYSLTGQVKDDALVDPDLNPKNMSGGIGIAYHFNLTNLFE